jgi:hypothetical protein
MSKVVEAKPPVSPGTEKDPRRETRLNLTISRVLAVGLFTAVILLVVGAVLTLTGRGPSPPSETSIGDIPRAVAAFEPGGFFDLGLLVLLATRYLGPERLPRVAGLSSAANGKRVTRCRGRW